MENNTHNHDVTELNLKGKTAIIIDDESVIRNLFSTYLSREGLQTLTASGGKEGIDIIQKEKIDVILLDLNMPEMSGFEVLEKLRGEIKDIPVIVVSGTGDVSDAIKAIKLGASDFLLKPVKELSIILHTVRRNIERCNLRKRSEEYKKELEQTVKKLEEGEIAAKKIQDRMLPPANAVLNGYHVSCDMIPSEYLSGDFLDCFAADDKNIVFYLADVSGHGVSSALVTVILNSFIRKHRSRYSRRDDRTLFNPEEVLRQLNQELFDEDLGKHMTIFYGVINLDEMKLTYANGGHFPPPLLYADKKPTFIGSGGSSVGLFPEVSFQCGEIELPSKFILNIFSDGVLDIFEEISMKDKLVKLSEYTTRTMISNFIANARDLHERPDDISVLSIESVDNNE